MFSLWSLPCEVPVFRILIITSPDTPLMRPSGLLRPPESLDWWMTMIDYARHGERCILKCETVSQIDGHLQLPLRRSACKLGLTP